MSERIHPDVVDLTSRALRRIGEWEATWGDFDRHAASAVEADRLDAALDDYLDRLGGNYPFFHPRYAGQMLKPPHPVAVAAYAAAMRINPNNHALDGGPPTGPMEKEVVADLAAMFGLPGDTLGHKGNQLIRGQAGTVFDRAIFTEIPEQLPGTKRAARHLFAAAVLDFLLRNFKIETMLDN